LFEAILWQLWEQSQTVAPPVYGADTPLRAQLLVFLQGKMRLLGDAGFIELSRVAMAELVHAPDRARGLLDRLSEKRKAWFIGCVTLKAMTDSLRCGVRSRSAPITGDS
jgi:TetR/AcrR family transcriptional regulator, regulator of autoinduction and epiphytic fitness